MTTDAKPAETDEKPAETGSSHAPESPSPVDEPTKFSPEEEASLLAESNAHKAEANAHFAAGRPRAALAAYDAALAACPPHLLYDRAVLQANAAACHLKLEAWPDAIASATAALDDLDRVVRAEHDAAAEAEAEAAARARQADDEADVEAEIISEGAAKAAPPPPPEARGPSPAELARRKRLDDVERMRAKALMRRARARSEEGGWARLEGALEDYKRLEGMGSLGPADRKVVLAQRKSLPARVKAAQEAETAEMWGKLKELGNGILKPFGMSTDNFKMAKDEATGGYSLNFQGGGGGNGGRT